MSLMDTARHRSDRAEHEFAESMRWAFREACTGAGVSLAVDAPIAGTSTRTPEVTYVQVGPPVRLTVRMLPGQVPEQLRRAGGLIAPHLGGIALRVVDRGFGWALVDVLTADPLAGVVPLQLPPTRQVFIGRGEDGQDITQDWRRNAHTIVQGVTRSGKSVWTYGLLVQLAAHPDTLIAGIDPTGLLWRPFAGTRHEEWQVSGLARLDRHERLLVRLVDEMDRRILALPMDRDSLEVTEESPMLVVVLEEHAGLLRAVDADDKDRGKRVRALIARLLAEGAKVGVRVVILVQRAEAAVVGAFERAMCSLRISFRTDNRASVELLHPGAPADVADAHTTAEPGVALLSEPGRPLSRIRAPYLGGYPEFVAAVRAHGR